MPTYKITNARDIESPRVVEADNPAAAKAHVAKTELTVERIDVATAFRLASNGVTLETAGEEPPKAEPKREPFDSGEEEIEGN